MTASQILESETTQRDECEGQKGTGFEWVLDLPTTQDRAHPQTYLVRYNNQCCLGANQSGLGFLPGIPHKKSTSNRSQLCILPQAAFHLTWLHLLCQSNACILQHPITSHRLQRITARTPLARTFLTNPFAFNCTLTSYHRFRVDFSKFM